MTRALVKLGILLLAVSFLIAPAVADAEKTVITNGQQTGQTDISAIVHEAVIHADFPVSLLSYSVNGQLNAERVTFFLDDTVVITLNRIPPGMVLKTSVTFDGVVMETYDNRITLTSFPRDRPVSIPVHLALEFTANVPDDSPSIAGTIPTYTPTPTETPTPDIQPDTPVTPDVPDETAKCCWWILSLILAAGILLLILLLRRKMYRILKAAAKRHGFKPGRSHLKEIARALIAMIRDKTAYPNWRKDIAVQERLRQDVIRVLDEMNYPAVPRDEISAEILKAGKGLFTRYRL